MSIVAGRDDQLPVVLLDDDGPGRQATESLRNAPLHKGQRHPVVNVQEFTKMGRSEVEDLLPVNLLAGGGAMPEDPAYNPHGDPPENHEAAPLAQDLARETRVEMGESSWTSGR